MPTPIDNHTEASNVAVRHGFWTSFAVTTHAILGLICVVEMMIVPRFIRIYEDFDAQLPTITILVINVYAAFGSLWFLMPVLALGFIVADAWITYQLFRNPTSRSLAVAWFFGVLSLIGVLAAITTLALFLPMFELMQNLS